MKTLKIILVSGAVLLAWDMPALAQETIEERLANMERRVQYLEERVAAQDEVIVEKDRQLAKLSRQEDRWFNSVDLGGLVEVEAAYMDPSRGDEESDVTVAEVKLGVAAQITDMVGAEVVLLYEEDDTDLEVDVAAISIGPFTAGQYIVPFGVFESNFISDSLTLELGETRESALQFGMKSGGLHGAVYAFNGDLDEDEDSEIDSFGATVGYSAEGEGMEFGLNLSYISDIGDSDNLQELVTDNLGENGIYSDQVSGWSASTLLRFNNLSLLAEYLGAAEDFEIGEMEFEGEGAEPISYMVEAALDFELAGMPATFALGYQETDEAAALELPEERFLVGLSVEMMDGVTLAVEGAFDEDYGDPETNDYSGGDADIVTFQLATEF
ncbi:MAG: LbtU family siderophore porin [Gammaproteobacteria bacterium]|nr:LbtU family siderophore porin [Gammaproteobacteria bacterium]